MIHIGRLIKDRLEERNMTIVDFSRELGCSRVNIYKILDKYSLDSNLLLRISKILEHDFFSYYSKELKDKEE